MKMKRILVLTVMMLAASVAQAKTVCMIETNSPNSKDTYDRVLFTGEVKAGIYILVDSKARSAQEISFQSFKDWQRANGKSLVTFGLNDNGSYGITLSRIDTSKTENILPLDSIVIGNVETDKPLVLIAAKKKLSMTCIATP
jgi:hypothetical protein